MLTVKGLSKSFGAKKAITDLSLTLEEGHIFGMLGTNGAGKSTLARKLGEKTGLPVVHLDQIWWEPGNWQHLEKPEFDALLCA